MNSNCNLVIKKTLMFLLFQTNFYTFTLVKYTIANVAHVNSHQMDFTKCTHKFHVIVLKIFNLPFFFLCFQIKKMVVVVVFLIDNYSFILIPASHQVHIVTCCFLIRLWYYNITWQSQNQTVCIYIIRFTCICIEHILRKIDVKLSWTCTHASSVK